MPNEYKQVGNQRIQLTDEEQAALDASRVKTPEQLETGLDEAVAHDGPALVEIITDAELT